MLKSLMLMTAVTLWADYTDPPYHPPPGFSIIHLFGHFQPAMLTATTAASLEGYSVLLLVPRL